MNRNYCNRFLSRKIDVHTRGNLYNELSLLSSRESEIDKVKNEIKSLFLDYFTEKFDLSEKRKLFEKSKRIANYMGRSSTYGGSYWGRHYNIDIVINKLVSGKKELDYHFYIGEEEFPEFREEGSDREYQISLVSLPDKYRKKYEVLKKNLDLLYEKADNFIKWDWINEVGADFVNGKKSSPGTFLDGYTYGELLLLCEKWFDKVIEINKFSSDVLYGVNSQERAKKHKEILEKLKLDLGD